MSAHIRTKKEIIDDIINCSDTEGAMEVLRTCSVIETPTFNPDHELPVTLTEVDILKLLSLLVNNNVPSQVIGKVMAECIKVLSK